MIHIKNTGCPYFEEVYFIVRSDEKTGDDDILREARRIVGSTGDAYKRGKMKNSSAKLNFFLYGASLCSLLFGLFMLICR